MDIISALSPLIIVTVLVLNSLLAFNVYRNNRKSATNIIFGVLSVTISIWLLILHQSTVISSSSLILLFTRLAVFFAVPLSALFFLLAHTLPSDNLLLSKHWFYLILIGTVLMMGFTLTPYVFKEVQIQGDTIKSIPGAGIPLFAGFTSFFSLAAIYVLIRKIRKSKGEAKQQLAFMMRGILLMLGLIIATIMIPVAIFQNQAFIPFSPLYALIFLGMTAYAIVKFHLFNLKVIATEAFTLILWIILFSNIITADTTVGQLINSLVFTVSILFGINLVRSVRNEVKQREQLEVLDKQLEDANIQLKILDKARAEFITIASHQLRTPPATIKWYLAAILDGDYGKFDDSVQADIRKINFIFFT